jgi:hypothetical protein
VRGLFHRNPQSSTAAEEPPPVPSPVQAGDWEVRLASVGRALDATGRELREVAVVTSGHEVLVAALCWSAGRYHDQWLPVTLVVDPEPFRSPDTATARQRRAGAGGWADRLGAVGAGLDQEPHPLRDALVLQLASGFAVGALVQDPSTGEWVLTSRAFPMPTSVTR